MGTITLDDNMLEDLYVAQLGPIAFAVHVAALMYCSRNKTDVIPFERVNTLIDMSGLRVDASNSLGLPGRGNYQDNPHVFEASALEAARHCVRIGLWQDVFGPSIDPGEKDSVTIGFRIYGVVQEPSKGPSPELPPGGNVVPFKH
jgi:hypothetical protein